MRDDTRPRWVTVPALAAELGMSRQRIWEMARQGLLPAIASGRRLLCDREALPALAVEQAAARRREHGGDR
ncbi:MAG: helix-turn-helix domain-containing protein [Deltaproteobacteria bacterium]|nr:helix-turn-helix domain-containing protein [Deltaproteobacteria bacterium]